MAAFIAYVFASRNLKGYQIRQKYFNHPYCNNISVVIYAHNDEKAIVSLLEKLNKQTYSKSNYQVHIVLDSSTDNSSNILEFVGGAKIWRVGDDEPLGKDAAVSWVLERLISFQNVNAYVFLDVNRKINDDFLTNINSALFEGDALVGSTELVAEEKAFVTSIKMAYNKFNNRIINCGRRFLFGGLAACIDSDITVIKQEVLEKIKCIDFKDVNSELKYTTLLVRNGVIPLYAPNIVTYANAERYEFKKPSTLKKFSLFLHCLPLMLTRKWRFIEHVFYLIRPNFLTMATLYFVLLWFTHTFDNYSWLFKTVIVQILGVAIIVAYIIALNFTRLNKKGVAALLVYPFFALVKNTDKCKVCRILTDKLFATKEKVQILEKFSVDVIVSGGQKSFKCKLEILTEENLSKAVFQFKRKKYTSGSHLRTYEAIREIVEKLEKHGFRMQICQTCGCFSHKLDAESNEIKGYCHSDRVLSAGSGSDVTDAREKESFLWNFCEKYIPKEINNVIDISTYM